MRLFCVAWFLVAAGSTELAAQQLLGVPAQAAAADGNSATWIPGCGESGTKQILVGAEHLSALNGHTIVGLVFRRDGAWHPALPSSTGHWTVRMGACASDPNAPAADLAANLPSASEVFRGNVNLPGMPSISGYAGWTSPHIVEITFGNGYPYSGGALAIEIDAALSSASAFFPMDAVGQETRGTIDDLGVACGPRVAGFVRTALSSGAAFAPGATTQLHCLSSSGNATVACFGAALLPAPLNLTPLGAPGCLWYIDSFTSLGATPQESGVEGLGALATVRLQVPSTAAVLGAQLYAQWLEVGSNSFASSQAVRLTVGTQLPTLGMAQLERLSDGSVHVAPACGPVIGFRYL